MNKFNAFKILFSDRIQNYEIIDVNSKKKIEIFKILEFDQDAENYLIKNTKIKKTYKIKKEKLEFYKKAGESDEKKFEKNNKIVDEMIYEIINWENYNLKKKTNNKIYFSQLKNTIYIIPIISFILLNKSEAANLLFIIPLYVALYFFNKFAYINYIILIILSLLFSNIYLFAFVIFYFIFLFFEKDIYYSNLIKLFSVTICCYIIFESGNLKINDAILTSVLITVFLPFIFWLNTKYLYEDRIILMLLILIIPINIKVFSIYNILSTIFILLLFRELIHKIFKKNLNIKLF